MALDVGFGAAFLAGLLSFLSPCILPLVPPYLCFLAGASLTDLLRDGEHGRTVRTALPRAFVFVLGFATVFVLLGASATALGRVLAEHLGWLTKVAGLLIVLFGLHFLGLIRIPILYREARMHVNRPPAGLVGAYLVGLAFAFGWTPCVGPVLASVLLVAGAEESAREGALLLAAYAAGIGLPFLAAAAFLPAFMTLLKGMRAWLGAFEKTMGGALVMTGILILLGLMPVIGAWLLETFPALGRIG